MSDNLKRDLKHVYETRAGRGGGTWAHWHIAMAYAKFLSNEFHMWANTVVRERHRYGRAFIAFVADNLKSRDTDLWQTRPYSFACQPSRHPNLILLTVRRRTDRDEMGDSHAFDEHQGRPDRAAVNRLEMRMPLQSPQQPQDGRSRLGSLRGPAKMRGPAVRRISRCVGVQAVRADSAVLRSHRRRASSDRFRFRRG